MGAGGGKLGFIPTGPLVRDTHRPLPNPLPLRPAAITDLQLISVFAEGGPTKGI